MQITLDRLTCELRRSRPKKRNQGSNIDNGPSSAQALTDILFILR
jgi:hypothetical protein